MNAEENKSHSEKIVEEGEPKEGSKSGNLVDLEETDCSKVQGSTEVEARREGRSGDCVDPEGEVDDKAEACRIQKSVKQQKNLRKRIINKTSCIAENPMTGQPTPNVTPTRSLRFKSAVGTQRTSRPPSASRASAPALPQPALHTCLGLPPNDTLMEVKRFEPGLTHATGQEVWSKPARTTNKLETTAAQSQHNLSNFTKPALQAAFS